MRLPEFEYVEPRSLKEAIAMLAAEPEAAMLAGGTDLLVSMKHRVIQPRRLINLKVFRDLAHISAEGGSVTIGSLTTLRAIASSSLLRKSYPAIVSAAGEVGAYALQVMGTLGGNLCQGNRCRYYNQSVFWRSARPHCYKAGGEICHIVRKPGECHSTYCGDVAPVLIALGADVTAAGPAGMRTFPLAELYTQDGKKPLSLKPGEIIKHVSLPPDPGTTVYLKWRLRQSIEFPIVSVALNLRKGKEGQVEQARVVFSGVGPGPVEAMKVEKLMKGKSLNERSAKKITDLAAKEISPMRTSIYSAAYKRRMAAVLLEKAFEEVERIEP
jgi:4-hydroxybenzoyl-CoA reductase subunit beta